MSDARRRVDIGGARLEAVVGGSGPVTGVFENGLGTALEEWEVSCPLLRNAHASVPIFQ